MIGLFATLRFVWFSILSDTTDPPKCPDYSSELCPWKHVFTDIAHRLQLLELAFKEQVVAREAMAIGVQNQSDINIILYKKLSTVIDKLDHLEKRYDSLGKSVSNLNIRVQSNGKYCLTINLCLLKQSNNLVNLNKYKLFTYSAVRCRLGLGQKWCHGCCYFCYVTLKS